MSTMIMGTVMESPSPFPRECRPIPSSLTRPTTFDANSVPYYFFFSPIGFAAWKESHKLLATFRGKYPSVQRMEDAETVEFVRDRARLLASLAAVYAVAGFRDRIRNAARADVEAALELMRDDFVGVLGASRSAHLRRRTTPATKGRGWGTSTTTSGSGWESGGWDSTGGWGTNTTTTDGGWGTSTTMSGSGWESGGWGTGTTTTSGGGGWGWS
ncbi:hypothetical protein B0H16DRAFT_1483200 [Mycena metata]|uniref:Uncharacterized protein n=1 Tax=Mycena metata TaxID=1033252 RepID=A0AAD7DY79_9AGAR|nr:hypothetical protein B0H16DRAFT_1483200 [Mycena metata]